ncbi:MAG: DUF1476 domain-containing protein [Rhizomicrobium sp.]|jgi:hypothetical protein
MTGSFDEREKAYEAKWAHDEELHFKVMARRNKLLGLWAASELGLSGAPADDYVKAAIQAGLIGKGADPVFEKIHADFAAHKTAHSKQAIHRKMEELVHLASEQVAGEQRS